MWDSNERMTCVLFWSVLSWLHPFYSEDWDPDVGTWGFVGII